MRRHFTAEDAESAEKEAERKLVLLSASFSALSASSAVKS